MNPKENVNERIRKFINSGATKDFRFMRALLVATIINQVKPSYTIRHIQLSSNYEQYIVSENTPENLFRNQELNYALQALIFNWFREQENILHSYVDDGKFSVFTLTRKIDNGDDTN